MTEELQALNEVKTLSLISSLVTGVASLLRMNNLMHSIQPTANHQLDGPVG